MSMSLSTGSRAGGASRSNKQSSHDVVTGAYGYTGRYITRRLLEMGRQVTTLTGRPDRPSPFGEQVPALSFNFDNPAALTKSLEGVDTLYNTYWVRFAKGTISHETAVKNLRVLIQAARKAGVRRLVHVSITGASAASQLPYFRGKGQVEEEIKVSGLSHAIVRPTVIFGREDVLINNIAWLLRRFPFFVVPGSGRYQVQPVFVEDLARLATALGRLDENIVTDAVGPETYTFDGLLQAVASSLGMKARIVHARPSVAFGLSRIVGMYAHDVILTKDEVAGLSANLLISKDKPTCKTSFKEWLAQNKDWLGKEYASELARHYH